MCGSSEPNEKVHKAAVLRSSIDTIRYLQGANSRLEKENRALKKSRKCPNCGGDTLRDLLCAGATTPPATEGEDSDSAPSPIVETKSSASPLALFAIAAGLFLINPVSLGNNSIMESSSSHPSSRVERSVEMSAAAPESSESSIWFPRIFALTMNLILFLIVYYLSGKIGKVRNFKKDQKKYENVIGLKRKLSKLNNTEKRREIEFTLSKFDTIPNNYFTTKFQIILALFRLPFNLMKKTSSDSNSEMKEEISKLYLEYGKLSGRNVLSSLRSINYSPSNESILLSSLIQSKSKLLMKIVFWLKKVEFHPFGSNFEGITFLKQHITDTNIHCNEIFANITEDSGNGGGTLELNQMICKYKEELISRGINQLFQFGRGINYFKLCLEAGGKNDKVSQFWASIMWTEAEWNCKGKMKMRNFILASFLFAKSL